jgi:hypothetical protein
LLYLTVAFAAVQLNVGEVCRVFRKFQEKWAAEKKRGGGRGRQRFQLKSEGWLPEHNLVISAGRSI